MIRVWIVEDNATFRNSVIQVVKDAEGISCDRAFGSCEALLEELTKGPPPNVILLDIRLPGLSGLDAIATIKTRAPETQILMLTMFNDQDSVFQALCAGASGYLLKTGTEDIADSIRQVATGGVPLSPSIARSVLSLFARIRSGPAKYHLTPREQSILELMVEGLLKKQIADRLQLSFFTVDHNLRRIYAKLHVNSGKSAITKALREKLC